MPAFPILEKHKKLSNEDFEKLVKRKEGANVYYIPIIEKYGRRDDILQRCIKMDEDLQKYFEARKKQKDETEFETQQVETQQETQPQEPEIDEDDNLPF